ncbi:hypothetical protein MDA_GLEAN10008950 [Myotis davidii]|uniref:Uncharacterized protein n=1 Tax=Myotis davidii TaxID=225400 RepID=L5M6R5_MYODS|nr:hypothetical protein MDA_GLEAN10008950 [Myotis davidii]
MCWGAPPLPSCLVRTPRVPAAPSSPVGAAPQPRAPLPTGALRSGSFPAAASLLLNAPTAPPPGLPAQGSVRVLRS